MYLFLFRLLLFFFFFFSSITCCGYKEQLSFFGTAPIVWNDSKGFSRRRRIVASGLYYARNQATYKTKTGEYYFEMRIIVLTQ
ncbi:hypothetical protein BDF21DRAFT_406971 [Thamnidium elegans]|nr:hypothetical protein BDF21DRAFT_406971 [Thamnidium elegans]